MRKIITSANYVRPKGEVNTSPSLTVPDQSIPLKTLLLNHTRGQELPTNFVPSYDEDDKTPDPKSLDLVDLQERRMALEDQRKTLNQEIIDNNKQSRKALAEAKAREEIEQAKKDLETGDAT